MATRSRATSSDLRLAIACLPRHTREAMLQGIGSNAIIVGAYSTDDGICPMLAAHRNGGRTSFISFARAWDRFAFRDSRERKRGRARRATDRELRVLRTYLEASLLEDEAPVTELAAARREHEELLSERARRAQSRQRDDRAAAPFRAQPGPSRPGSRDGRPGDADRRRELDSRPGWAWTRLVRRYDDYEALLERLEVEADAMGAPPARAPLAGGGSVRAVAGAVGDARSPRR